MPKGKKWKIESLVVDKYVGNRNKRLSKDAPTIDDVTKAILGLNGGNTSSLCLVGSDDSVLAVGGGPDGYHVQITYTASVFLLTDSSKNDEMMDIIIGSVRTPLPAKYIVDEETTLEAARCYFDTGELAKTLRWEKS